MLKNYGTIAVLIQYAAVAVGSPILAAGLVVRWCRVELYMHGKSNLGYLQ